MNDPFFSAVDEAQPVFASKTLKPDESPSFDNFSHQNNYYKEDTYNNNNNNFHSRERQNTNYNRDHPPSRSAPHRPQNYRNKDQYSYQRNQPRLPSMLNDIKAPKPLKINPNKPPESKKYFDIQIPDHFTYAKPYDGV